VRAQVKTRTQKASNEAEFASLAPPFGNIMRAVARSDEEWDQIPEVDELGGNPREGASPAMHAFPSRALCSRPLLPLASQSRERSVGP
jgi:hypothetical protein